MNEALVDKTATAGDLRVLAQPHAALATPASQHSQVWKKEYAGIFGKLAPVAIVVSLSLPLVWAMIHFKDSLASLGHWRYAGVFLAELSNSATILVPTPAPAFTLGMATVLNPVLVGIIGGVGASLGELTGYYGGTRGRRMIEGGRLHTWFQALARGRVGLTLFAFALVPLPIDFAGLWAGAVRYPVLKFLVSIAVGKMVKLTAVAFAASYGLTWLA